MKTLSDDEKIELFNDKCKYYSKFMQKEEFKQLILLAYIIGFDKSDKFNKIINEFKWYEVT